MRQPDQRLERARPNALRAQELKVLEARATIQQMDRGVFGEPVACHAWLVVITHATHVTQRQRLQLSAVVCNSADDAARLLPRVRTRDASGAARLSMGGLDGV